jgi:acyl-CoA thioester hydrolase
VPLADPIEFTARWPVRVYELDSNGHVNNAVYLNWAEEITTMHAEAAGYGRDWTIAQGGVWVVHRSEIDYRRAAMYGDLIELTVRVLELRGAHGTRRTWIKRAADGELLCTVLTEWAWTRASDGRPARVPRELITIFEAHAEKTSG